MSFLFNNLSQLFPFAKILRREGKAIYRTILVTECIHLISGLRTTIYGRYDPVTLQRKSLKVLRSYPKRFSMTDEEFAKHGHEMEDKK